MIMHMKIYFESELSRSLILLYFCTQFIFLKKSLFLCIALTVFISVFHYFIFKIYHTNFLYSIYVHCYCFEYIQKSYSVIRMHNIYHYIIKFRINFFWLLYLRTTRDFIHDRSNIAYIKFNFFLFGSNYQQV